MKTIKANFMNQLANHPRVASKVTAEKQNLPQKNIKGFTLVELLVVCVILGVLVLIGIPHYTEFTGKVQIGRCRSEVRGLEHDVIAYASDNGAYPDTLVRINKGDLRDPWGNQYQYAPVGTYLDSSSVVLNPESFDLYSLGKDGNTDFDLSLPDPNRSLDDVVRYGDGAGVDINP